MCGDPVFVLAASPWRPAETATESRKARADARTAASRQAVPGICHRAAGDANNLFTQGDVEKGQAEIREVVEYAQKRPTRPQLRQTTEGNRDRAAQAGQAHARHRRNPRFRGPPPVHKAVDEIEQIRSDLLVRMWGRKPNRKENHDASTNHWLVWLLVLAVRFWPQYGAGATAAIRSTRRKSTRCARRPTFPTSGWN